MSFVFRSTKRLITTSSLVLRRTLTLQTCSISKYCTKPFCSMASNEDVLAPLRAAVKEQGDIVRRLKEEKRPKTEITEAVAKLKACKKRLEDQEKKLLPKEVKFDREGLESLLKRRFFYSPAFSIYGGVAGLYDYGPMGCAMKGNVVSLWRSHFVLEEQLLEVDCSILTPYPVLKASGHVDRFSDFMVKDVKTGECFRADQLLADHLEQLLADPKCPADKKEEYNTVLRQVEEFTQEQLGEMITKYNVVSPVNKNEVSPPQPFNLMFGTSIGPDHGVPAFLRPETAQGIFVNFKKLLEFNNGRLPFGAAQIGAAFRNEVSPRAGLLRIREFMMAEIEYFVHPDKKQSHRKFSSVADLVVTLYSSSIQMSGQPAVQMALGDAIKQGLIANETLGYYLGRIFLFMKKVGVDEKKLRFRQHLDNEMAHYACDCWDAECHTSYGWVECVGCADRSCFDLNCHMKHSGANLYAQETLSEPRIVQRVQAVPDKGIMGKEFRAKSKLVMQKLSEMSNEQVEELEATLKKKGSFELQLSTDENVTISPNMVNIKRFEEKIHVEDVLPSVIEPSFGIGRIMYSVLEHNFRVREGDENRNWLSLPAQIAPVGCSVLPLSSNEQFEPFVRTISEKLTQNGVKHKVDDSSGSIGRRYARTDEIAIPFGVTIDFDTIKTSSVTLRERNTTRQVRVKIEELPPLVADLLNGRITWPEVEQKYPVFVAQETAPQ